MISRSVTVGGYEIETPEGIQESKRYSADKCFFLNIFDNIDLALFWSGLFYHKET